MSYNNMNTHTNSNSGNPIDIPGHPRSLSFSVPRRTSLSSSFSFGTSSHGANPFLNPAISPSFTTTVTPPPSLATSFPTTSSISTASLSTSPPTSVLGRRLSVGFHPLAQMAQSSTAATSPPSVDNSSISSATGGLLRKFGLGGSIASGDKNSTELDTPSHAQAQQQHQQHSSIFSALQSNRQQQHPPPSSNLHPTTVQYLKSPANKDTDSRSSSPMRSMILNGQMLD
ncbi:hypothetical protein BGZ94_004503 [Podila epigama]|nr:hypothetical protein BGZ94_004503 [Podila epigama]